MFEGAESSFSYSGCNDRACLRRAPLLVGQGVDDASGKKWFRFHLEPEAARALRDFTQAPADRGFVVLVGGTTAARHKIRTPIVGDDIQISCCNPAACARWMTMIQSE